MITTIRTFKLLRLTAPCMAMALVTACGGGGGGSGTPPPATTYTVSATAGSGGSIAPSSATVNADGTTTFTVTPNSGYDVTGVVGCAGTLSGNTYTTGPASANCTVTASFSAAFTWISGSNTPDAVGVYGTQGTAAATNVPGGRHGPITWIDATGNLWLYGGYGVGSPILNDMWKYSPSSGQWTWVSGSSTPDAAAVYGTLGVAAPTNTPGALGSSAYSWTDTSGNVWVFGGYGYDSTGTRGWLNALWEYSPASGQWTWFAGSTTNGASGVYGTQGVAAPTNYPGARAGGGWKDSSGNVWLFGAYGYDSAGTLGYLNDLWKYSHTSQQWTWVGGSNTVNAPAVYGTQGVAAATNVPGGRTAYGTWTDANGNLWLFGGNGHDSAGTLGSLNDLWEYSPATSMWTWVNGSNTVHARGVYGAGSTPAPLGPGARYGTTTWTDPAGNLWLFGGVGYDGNGTGNSLNDLWKYSPSSQQWTWVAGSNVASSAGVYGTEGVAASTNIPGARDSMSTWVDPDGSVWLFGGEGLNISGADPSAAEWNDLWKYPTQ